LITTLKAWLSLRKHCGCKAWVFWVHTAATAPGVPDCALVVLTTCKQAKLSLAGYFLGLACKG